MLLFFLNLNNKKDQPIWIGKSELKAETETVGKNPDKSSFWNELICAN